MLKHTEGADGQRDGLRLLTVGHGTLSADELTRVLVAASVQAVVDVRSAPGSRHNPQFGRAELEQWLPATGISYRCEPDLGGFRRPVPNSPNVALRHPSFRGYADHMESTAFEDSLTKLLDDAHLRVTCAMCAETLWWRCHRRLIADAAVLLHHAHVWHLDHQGRLMPHRLTDGVRVAGRTVVYDVAARSQDTNPVSPATSAES